VEPGIGTELIEGGITLKEDGKGAVFFDHLLYEC
jgi:hypothetical protein